MHESLVASLASSKFDKHDNTVVSAWTILACLNILCYTPLIITPCRIVVSAPRLTVPGSNVSNTGAVYTCPVTPGRCEGLLGNGTGADNRLFDTEGMVRIMDSGKQLIVS